MLPTANRLRASRDFTETVRRGRRAAGPALVTHVTVVEGSPAPVLVGIVASRAVGPAVSRNRVRRQLRHLMRARLDRCPAGTRLVLRVRPGATKLTGGQLAAQLDALLTRAVGRVGEAP